MAFFMDPGAMFLGCLNGVEQKFLIELIKNARVYLRSRLICAKWRK